jgi:hypothetical protein
MAPRSEADFQLSQPAGRFVLFSEELSLCQGTPLPSGRRRVMVKRSIEHDFAGLNPVVLPNRVEEASDNLGHGETGDLPVVVARQIV